MPLPQLFPVSGDLRAHLGPVNATNQPEAPGSLEPVRRHCFYTQPLIRQQGLEMGLQRPNHQRITEDDIARPDSSQIA